MDPKPGLWISERSIAGMWIGPEPAVCKQTRENALFACMTFDSSSHVTCLEVKQNQAGSLATNTHCGGQGVH
jgi:hypothetical protein